MIKKVTLMIIVLSFMMACRDNKQSQSLTVASLGGIHARAQEFAFYKPFQKEADITIIRDSYHSEMAKIRSMVETRQVNWDIVQVETPNLMRGCSEGIFEPIDGNKIGHSQNFVKGSFSECGIGFFTWSIILSYNTEKLTEPPRNWQDFWDVKSFPGKRGLQKTPMIAMEIALLADGVDGKELYNVLATPEGVNRAFKKLDQLKPYISWWEKGSQPIPMLITGDVVMTTTFNGRAVMAKQEGRAIDLVWNDSFYDMDNFAIVKGSHHKQYALEFIKFALRADRQKAFSEYAHYGFANNATVAMVDPEVLATVSNNPAYMKKAYHIDSAFWVEHGEKLQQRFNVWAAQ